MSDTTKIHAAITVDPILHMLLVEEKFKRVRRWYIFKTGTTLYEVSIERTNSHGLENEKSH